MKDTIEKLLIMVSMLATVLAAGPANADLVAHWRFDETSGTTAHDSSGNGYHAAAVEGTPIWDSNGRQGGCLNFDATYGMSIPTEAFEDINEAISISMWVNYHPNQPDNATVLFQAGTDVNQKHSFIVSVRTKWRDDELEFETGYEEESSETWGDAKLNDRAGRWDHYVFVTDTTESFQGIYHNGLRVAGGSDSNPMPGITRAHIGLATDRVHDQQRARIDDVRIYNHGLSTEEVNQLYSLRPKLMKLGEAVQKGEATLNQKGPREAMLQTPLRLRNYFSISTFCWPKPSKVRDARSEMLKLPIGVPQNTVCLLAGAVHRFYCGCRRTERPPSTSVSPVLLMRKVWTISCKR
jgi:hypothetical protein